MWLIAIAIALLVIVGPVMVGARVVGAGRTGFWICLGALIVRTSLSRSRGTCSTGWGSWRASWRRRSPT